MTERSWTRRQPKPHWVIYALAPFAVLLTLTGCVLMDAMYGGRPNRLGMEPNIHALDGLNSPFDDFNAVAVPPPLRMDALIIFASNAASQGEHFSIDMGRLQLVQNPYSQSRDKTPPPPELVSTREGAFGAIPAGMHNVRGPTALVSLTGAPVPYDGGTFSHYTDSTLGLDMDKAPLAWATAGALGEDGVWMFDSDATGVRKLYFLDESGAPQPFFGNVPHADDAYVTYDFARHELYFSSNRSGRYQLYRFRNQSHDTRFVTWLGDPALAAQIEPAAEFSADGNTLAPFIEGDWLVFASDRAGGFGGYDLYAAHFQDGAWGPVQNLQAFMPEGVRLNTPANEFRPSILPLRLVNYHELRVLIFSSDRPGGQGGYDLYLTALPSTR